MAREADADGCRAAANPAFRSNATETSSSCRPTPLLRGSTPQLHRIAVRRSSARSYRTHVAPRSQHPIALSSEGTEGRTWHRGPRSDRELRGHFRPDVVPTLAYFHSRTDPPASGTRGLAHKRRSTQTQQLVSYAQNQVSHSAGRFCRDCRDDRCVKAGRKLGLPESRILPAPDLRTQTPLLPGQIPAYTDLRTPSLVGRSLHRRSFSNRRGDRCIPSVCLHRLTYRPM